MRLTADVLQKAENYINPCKEREINLRGYKIPVIENISLLQDQYDVIDLSDNEIKRLDNFPSCSRLTTIALCNNYINRISSTLGESVTNLRTLVLTNNRLLTLSEIENLSTCVRLQHLVLLENPVVDQKHYRLYVIHKIPSLRSLDFAKVTKTERDQARKFFKGTDGKEVISEVSQQQAAAAAAAAAGASKPAPPQAPTQQLTDDQKAQIRAAIEAANTKEEIELIEKQLRTGTFAFRTVGATEA